jgi:hypothetical protein
MTRASEAYDRLHTAMTDSIPECVGIDLFTADSISTADLDDLRKLCDSCPLRKLCDEYARLERPKVGLWAGKQYGTKKTKGTL